MFPVTEYGVTFAKQYRAEQIAAADQHRLARRAGAEAVQPARARNRAHGLVRWMHAHPLLRHSH
ncbi:MAG: hypothetical protein ACRDO2_13210 [Nocardioidaceae bacterium]